MSSNTVSAALSMIEARLDILSKTNEEADAISARIFNLQNEIDRLNFKLNELQADKEYHASRIDHLKRLAMEEGYSEEYLNRFLKERHYRV